MNVNLSVNCSLFEKVIFFYLDTNGLLRQAQTLLFRVLHIFFLFSFSLNELFVGV
jgi:hypothetical protein